jgi:hypothetical protein
VPDAKRLRREMKVKMPITNSSKNVIWHDANVLVCTTHETAFVSQVAARATEFSMKPTVSKTATKKWGLTNILRRLFLRLFMKFVILTIIRIVVTL